MRLTKVAELLAGQGLHFDDFRPLVSQHHGGHRSGDHAGEVDNFNSIERAHSNSMCFTGAACWLQPHAGRQVSE